MHIPSLVHSKLQTPAMSPSHPHTVSVAAVNPLLMYDDEDNDICPVCDGECTCDNRPRSFSTTNNRNGSLQSIASTSTYKPASPAPAPAVPSLKIKFTVPPSMLGKRRASSFTTKKYRSAEETTYAGGNEKDSSLPPPGKSHILPPSSPSSQDLSVPKRRGRPPKAVLAARDLKGIAAAHATTTSAGPSYQSQPSRSYKRKDPLSKPKTKAIATRRLPKHKVKCTIVKKSAAKKRRVVSSDSSSDLSDVPPNFGYGEDDDDDAQSVQFPTFVPASAMSASTSSNDSDMASSSGFDTDSSIEAEEENFILAEESRAREKARVRRELLGDESGQKRRDPHNNWVIRPRKQSVGPSDAEMDVDSDATEDEEEDEEEEAAEADEEEPDDRAPGEGYAGVATGWSEDEESSFDADLFFANLSDTSGEDGTSSSDDDDVNQSDMDTLTLSEATMASLIPHLRQELENLPFEVTEGWDGQIVFTNGLRDGQGILDLDFEVNAAAQLAAETSASPSQESDMDMTTDGEDEDEGDEAFGDGETTDEELVGEDQLPNERAMKLYNPITSVSAINPMSTMSPTVSPGPWNRRRFGSPIHRDSPKPADILAGKVFWDESDEPEDGEDSPYQTGSVGSLPRPPLNTLIEVEPGEKNPQRRVVIDGTKPTPCPYPRSKHGRGRSISRLGRFDDVRLLSYSPHNFLVLMLQIRSYVGDYSHEHHLYQHLAVRLSTYYRPKKLRLPQSNPLLNQ